MEVLYFRFGRGVVDHAFKGLLLERNLAMTEEKIFRRDEIRPGGLPGFIVTGNELHGAGRYVDIDRSEKVVAQWNV